MPIAENLCQTLSSVSLKYDDPLQADSRAPNININIQFGITSVVSLWWNSFRDLWLFSFWWVNVLITNFWSLFVLVV